MALNITNPNLRISIYEGESTNHTFFFGTGIITDTGTYIIHQNGRLGITSLLLNIVTVSLKSNAPPSNESMIPAS